MFVCHKTQRVQFYAQVLAKIMVRLALRDVKQIHYFLERKEN